MGFKKSCSILEKKSFSVQSFWQSLFNCAKNYTHIDIVEKITLFSKFWVSKLDFWILTPLRHSMHGDKLSILLNGFNQCIYLFSEIEDLVLKFGVRRGFWDFFLCGGGVKILRNIWIFLQSYCKFYEISKCIKVFDVDLKLKV